MRTIIVGIFFLFGINGVSASSNNTLSVFLDQHNGTDDDYIRQEIPVVNYVRDKELADVHIIISKHDAGQAGVNYVISFIGRRQFSGINNELEYWASSSQTGHETRQGYTKMIKVGLAPYIVRIGNMLDQISLQYKADSIPVVGTKGSDVDFWRRWIFEVYAGGNFESEKTHKAIHIRYGFYADKITKDWKIRARPYFNYNRDDYELKDSTFTVITHRNGFNGYMIKSVRTHWGAGVFVDMLSSVYDNMDMQVQVAPAIEYSLFPYEEATRRSIAFAYKLDYTYNNYMDETIFGKNAQTLWGQSLVLSADFRQPWGNVRTSATGSHHFHNLKSNRVEMFSSLSLRVFKGFSLNVEAKFNLINDLVAIPAKELTTEEILLEQRKRLTNYEFKGYVGFTYTFGSALSADYNPRL